MAETPAAPLVSIVIPCYNHARYLPEAIESAIAQTYTAIEIVVVDDGSSDHTADVARQYPVLLLQQPNRGPAAAGNAGVRASHGVFVMRFDADDRLKPTYVEETVQPLLKDPNLHFVYTEVDYFGARTGSYPVEDFDRDSLTERNYIHVGAMMRRSSFDAVGGYRTDMRGLRCEDWDLWLSFAERDLKGKLVRKRLLEYRQHMGASEVTINMRSLSGLRRELKMVTRLYQHHPRMFAPPVLLGRLRLLPGRLGRREVNVRFALMLVSFYAVLLMQYVLRIRSRPRLASAAKT